MSCACLRAAAPIRRSPTGWACPCIRWRATSRTFIASSTSTPRARRSGGRSSCGCFSTLTLSRATMTAIAKAAMSLSMLALLAACAAQRPAPMKEDELSLSLQPQIHAVHHEPQRAFSVQSTGYIVAAVLLPTPLVFLAATADGDELKREFALEDPVSRMKQRLVSSLESRLKLTNMTAVSAPLRDDDIETLKRDFESGLALDVRTVKWGIFAISGQRRGLHLDVVVALLLRVGDLEVERAVALRPAVVPLLHGVTVGVLGV